MLRGVTFDWWNTLALPADYSVQGWIREGRVREIHRTLVRLGIRREVEAVSRAYNAQSEGLRALWKQQKDMGPREQLVLLLGSLGQEPTEELVSALIEPYGQVLLEAPIWLREGAQETLRAVQDLGLKVGLISNSGRTWGGLLRKVMARQGLDSSFHSIVFSDECGVRKPNTAIFDRAAEELGLPPEDILHIGDDPEADVMGAHQAGFKALWLYVPGWHKDMTEGEAADGVILDLREALPHVRRWRT